MNILHVNAAYDPFIGGAETYVRAVSEMLCRDGHSVTLVTTNAAEVEYFWNPGKRHLAPGYEEINGVQVTRCAVGHLPLAPFSFYGLRRLATIVARLPFNTLPVMRRLAPMMPAVPQIESVLQSQSTRFDLVHGFNIALEWPLLAAWRYARRQALPFVATPFLHVGQSGRDDVLINYAMPHQLEALQDADAVLVQTGIEKAALVRLGVAADRLYELGMGVEVRSASDGDGQGFRVRHSLGGPIVTFLGVVTYDKGSFHLVQAMEHLWEKGLLAHLVIAGPQVDEFKRFYRRLAPAIQDRMLLLGPVHGQDKRDLLAATDVLALPSRIDSFGIVYLEAWANRKPVIGARAGGVPDVIDDGVDGVLVEFGDVDELAAAIQSLLADPSRRQEMGEKGWKKVTARYTWDKVYSRLRAVYKEVLD
ncbi:MAG: glycosyltransferase family 4 protein [Anaerolineae bacterium]|nr:glycosyltransferase family 4 protein [Anaerolineae bacterium]